MKYSKVISAIQPEERARLHELKNKYQGERCFIVGNGPSLNAHNLDLLKNEYSFGVNSIFLKTKDTGFRPSFYTVEDGHVVDDNLEAIRDYDVDHKFILAHYRDKFPGAEDILWLSADLGFYRDSHPFGGTARFSRDAAHVVYAGQSVTHINLQIAFYLGFSEVYLIGMDFHYDKPESVITQGLTWISTEDDPNHFDPSYFGAGKKWHDPQLDKVALNYQLARRVFERNGRKIFNATHGGKLEIFERADYDALF
tara:strand:+ start:941 stop:1702 length:762 start_codon:yes stop_codon:yes gene_type:complete